MSTKLSSLGARLIIATVSLLGVVIAVLSWTLVDREAKALDEVSTEITTLTDEVLAKQEGALASIQEARIETAREALRARIGGLASLLADIAPLPISTYDFGILESQCKQMYSDASVELCYVIDPSNEMLAGATREAKTSPEDVKLVADALRLDTEEIFELTFPVSQDGEVLGQVVILARDNLANAKDESSARFLSALENEFESTLAGVQELTSQKTKEAALLAVLMGVVALGLGTLGAFLISRRITVPIRSMVTSCQAISKGDLTRRVDVERSDEIGELARRFNTVVQSLHDLILQVHSGTSQIADGSRQVADSSQTLSNNNVAQASGLEQMTTSLQGISTMSSANAKDAGQASKLSVGATESAGNAQGEMKEMRQAMAEIQESSSEIAGVIRVIDEIAFQTNLLALNAAVEAARAGEAGSGFAVVAEEVRNLAQRSATAAKDTATMIDQASSRAENGVAIAARVGGAMDQITESIGSVNELLSQIASVSGGQAAEIDLIYKSLAELESMTAQGAGNSEELAASSHETSTMVTSILEVLSKFDVVH